MPLQFTPRRTGTPPKYPNAIREYRIKSGLTQRALATSLGIGRRVISTWECGRSLPTLPNLFRLAKTLGTLAESLYHDIYCAWPKREDENQPNA